MGGWVGGWVEKEDVPCAGHGYVAIDGAAAVGLSDDGGVDGSGVHVAFGGGEEVDPATVVGGWVGGWVGEWVNGLDGERERDLSSDKHRQEGSSPPTHPPSHVPHDGLFVQGVTGAHGVLGRLEDHVGLEVGGWVGGWVDE